VARWSLPNYTIGQPYLSEELALLRREFPEYVFAVTCEEYKINPVLRMRSQDLHLLETTSRNASTSRWHRRLLGGQPVRLASPPA